MQRRQFVKISGSALAGLYFQNIYIGSGGGYLLNIPEEVLVQSGNEWFTLRSSNGNSFIYKEIEVILKQNGDSISVYVNAPSAPLNSIRIGWKYKLNKEAKGLGDHWERSYGDLNWQTPSPDAKEPWYIVLHDNNNTIGFGVKTGCNSICYWQLKDDKILLTMDVRSGGTGVKIGSRKLHAADIVTIKNKATETVYATTRRFCTLMCANPRLPKQPVYGINDWYFAYGNNSAKLIRELTGAMTGLAPDTNNRPFSVIDAGWAAYSPLLPDDCCWQEDFSRPNNKFKDMHILAQEIKSIGMWPGLWTRPLCAKHDDKKSLLLPFIPGRNNEKNPLLDPSIPECIERIKYNFNLYQQWGYELVKHDFTTYDMLGKWGFEMKSDITTPGWKFNDQNHTTAEIINHLYGSIRSAAGNMNLLGCNTMSHLGAGVFEISRIGDDTSGKEWERTKKMGVNALAFRIAQHNSFYSTDADCVGLTDKISWEKNRQWMQLLTLSGTPLFISAQPDVLGKAQKSAIQKSFATAARSLPVGEPLDWLSNPLPVKWKLNNEVHYFNWD